MSLLDQFVNQSDKKRTIDGQSYWHHSLLSNWLENEDARDLKNKSWLRILMSIKKKGIKQPFEIDVNGTVYDGNNRLRGINELISEGITKAENGKELEWVPVNIHESPKDLTGAIKIAGEGNSDEYFATWNKDYVANHKAEFMDAGLSKEQFIFDDPVTFGEVFETYNESFMDETEIESKPKKETCEKCQNYHERNHQVI